MLGGCFSTYRRNMIKKGILLNRVFKTGTLKLFKRKSHMKRIV